MARRCAGHAGAPHPDRRRPRRGGNQQCDADGVYCWTVETAGEGWDLVFRTTPDVTRYHVEPGRGVTRFEYHHNGTADDVVLDRDED